MTFLFWNLHRRDLRDSLRRLAVRHEVDVFVLAECDSIAAVLLGLNPEGGKADYVFAEGAGQNEPIQIFTRFPSSFQEAVQTAPRFTIRRIGLPGKPDILLAAAHLLSGLYADKIDRFTGAQRFAQTIQETEREAGHNRTVVVGDLNMNPFDDGVAGSSALHGVMTKDIARRETRMVQNRVADVLQPDVEPLRRPCDAPAGVVLLRQER